MLEETIAAFCQIRDSIEGLEARVKLLSNQNVFTSAFTKHSRHVDNLNKPVGATFIKPCVQQSRPRTDQSGAMLTEGAGLAEGTEGKLRGEVQLLKEQVASAFEKAAEATSRIAQYQALAESSNQALEAMQV